MTFIHDFGELNRHRIRDLALAGVIALSVIGGIVTIAQTVAVMAAQDNPAATQAAPKTDRLDTLLPAPCAGETWGNWSAACVSAITGTSAARQVRFETLESRDGAARTSVLARVPHSS